MKKIIIIVLCLYLFSCGRKDLHDTASTMPSIHISSNGDTIIFDNLEQVNLFETEIIKPDTLETQLEAPGKIAALIMSSQQGADRPLILFDDPELSGNYTQLIQHQINIHQIQNVNIKQRQIELERIKDLYTKGASSGQDLLNAETALAIEMTNLLNEKAALIEHETKLISAGFSVEQLKKTPPGSAILICEIPENLMNYVQSNQTCFIHFSAMANQDIKAKVEALADIVDNETRMIKVRILLNQQSGIIKLGMFAQVKFYLKKFEGLSVNKSSLITVQGKHYVFVKKNINTMVRRQVKIGSQMENRVVVYDGIKVGEEVVITQAFQLKGLSFGY